MLVRVQRRRAVQRRQLRERVANREEDAVDLQVLVCAYVCTGQQDHSVAKGRAYR